MLSRLSAVVAFVALLVAGGPTISQSQPTPPLRPLTVVELFTSQGCSSCPPANANLAVLARHDDILALSFGVTYWDYLGWRDTFGSVAYTQRQRDYARGLNLTNLYTPQMVVNGRIDTVGNQIGDLNNLVRRTPRLDMGPNISVSASGVTLSATTRQSAASSIWVIRYDPRVVQVPIRRGENGGKTLPHINVVRELSEIGRYTGRAMTVRLPPITDPNLRTAILVQTGAGGPIIAAAKL